MREAPLPAVASSRRTRREAERRDLAGAPGTTARQMQRLEHLLWRHTGRLRGFLPSVSSYSLVFHQPGEFAFAQPTTPTCSNQGVLIRFDVGGSGVPSESSAGLNVGSFERCDYRFDSSHVIHRRFGIENTVRASLALYNTCSDIDALAAALRRIQTARSAAKA